MNTIGWIDVFFVIHQFSLIGNRSRLVEYILTVANPGFLITMACANDLVAAHTFSGTTAFYSLSRPGSSATISCMFGRAKVFSSRRATKAHSKARSTKMVILLNLPPRTFRAEFIFQYLSLREYIGSGTLTF